jgi:queuine tRNA-ribosyltransferase
MRIRNHRLECRFRIAGWTMWALCVVPRSIQALTMLRWPSSHRDPFVVTTNQNRQVHPSIQHWVTRAHSSDTMTAADVPNCTSDGTDAPPDEATEPASSFLEGTIEDTCNATAPLWIPVPTNATSRRSRKKQLPVPPLPTPDDFAAADYTARSFFRFELRHVSARSGARVGRLHTPHGVIDTPAFVAVATNGALKGVDFRQLPPAADAQEQLIFCNTYHLLIQPGAEVIGAAGGIHAFTKRNGPFITDSGGFQVFSLAYGSVAEDLASKGELKRSNSGKYSHNGQLSGADAVQVTEDGAIFRSYRDGSKLLLTPETTVQAQKLIGADIIIPLDELPGYYVDRERLVESVARTHRWEARSLQEHLRNVNNQAMYCVIHGGMDRELRQQSVDYLTSLPFDGYGIGGSLGNGRAELQELLTWLMPMFNINERIASKPRHLLGIADEESIRNAIPLGLDTFDSCYPTRLGRHGTVLTRQGLLRLPSGTHARSFGMKIDAACTCTTCQTYDRAYLCHLFKANEPIAINLASIHNIHYMYDLMAQLRQAILDDKI